MRISWPWSLALDVLAEGATLAAQQLCPMDHTGAQRRQAVRDAEEAAADALNEVEAEVDHLEPFRTAAVMAMEYRDAVKSKLAEAAEVVEDEAWEANELFDRAAADEVRTSTCGCGREFYADMGKTGVLLGYFHTDDESPVTAECAVELSREPLRADGTHADAPGEVSRPSPGDLTDAELLAELADVLETSARYATPETPGLIAEAKARAARPNVSHEDVAAHITAAIRATHPGLLAPWHEFKLADAIAASLLADFHITPK